MAKSFDIGVSVDGIRETDLKLKGSRQVAGLAMAKTAYVEAEKIMAVSKSTYVPVKTGVLRSTGHVQPPKIVRSWVWSVELGYGGPSAPYAVVQHESTHFKHDVGEDKYLEKPALAAAPHLGERMAKEVHAALVRFANSGRLGV